MKTPKSALKKRPKKTAAPKHVSFQGHGTKSYMHVMGPQSKLWASGKATAKFWTKPARVKRIQMKEDLPKTLWTTREDKARNELEVAAELDSEATKHRWL